VALLAGLQPWVAADVLFRDPLAVAGGEPYFGIVSNLGVLVWAAACAISLFTGFQLRRIDPSSQVPGFLLWSGAISLVLMLDDFLLLHEVVYLNLLGLPETVLFAGYGVAVASYLVRYREVIARFDGALLGAALAFFATSLFFDKLTGPRAPGFFAGHPPLDLLLPLVEWIAPIATLLEDGPKLAGIALWGTYLVRASWRAPSTPDHANR
jgi:hypothetical protein